MEDSISETALLTRQAALPAVVVDMRAPGGLEMAVQDALQAVGLCREMVAIVLVPLGTAHPSWPVHISELSNAEGIVIDAPGHAVHVYGRPVSLTVKEFTLLHYLYERRGVVISRQELLRDIWGENYGVGPRTVDIHVRRLRAKLGADWIETIRRVGYKFRR
jgi:DNA-binding response OmpR family regulator